MLKKAFVFILLTGEVDIVALHIKALSEAGVQVKDIAIIAPYNLQVRYFSKYSCVKKKHVLSFYMSAKQCIH